MDVYVSGEEKKGIFIIFSNEIIKTRRGLFLCTQGLLRIPHTYTMADSHFNLVYTGRTKE